MPTEVRVSSPEEFMTFVDTASPDDRAVYHIGHLSIDTDPELSAWTSLSQMDFSVLAGLALRFERIGKVALVQRRLIDVRGDDDDEFAYIAARRS